MDKIVCEQDFRKIIHLHLTKRKKVVDIDELNSTDIDKLKEHWLPIFSKRGTDYIISESPFEAWECNVTYNDETKRLRTSSGTKFKCEEGLYENIKEAFNIKRLTTTIKDNLLIEAVTKLED